MPDSVVSDSSLFVSTSPVFDPETARREHTCSRCWYSGPLQMRQSYPFLLRKSVIAAAFCCGILPGLLLRHWRRKFSPTVAIVCPQCAFLRLELKPPDRPSH